MLDKIKKHADNWQRDLSVQSKFMIIVLWPQHYDAGYMKEAESSLRRAISTCEDCISKSSVYFLQNGLEQLKNVQ